MSRILSGAWLAVSCTIAAALNGCDRGVAEPTVDAIAIRQVADTVEVGQVDSLAVSLRAGATPVANIAGVRWASSNPDVFTVDSVTGVGVAKAVANPQTVTVTASYKALRAQLPVVVIPQVAGLRLLVSASIALGHTVTAVAGLSGAEPFGIYAEASSSWGVQFESANPGVIRVNADGTLTALALGTARVRVTLHGKRDSTDVTVMDGYPMNVLSADLFAVADVNDNGEVLGTRPPATTLMRNSERIVLGICAPRGINNQSQVLCGSSVYANGQATDVFGSGPFAGSATGINESGDVFGLLTSPDSLRNRAFVWRSGIITVLGPPADGVSLMQTGRVNLADHGLAQSAFLYTYPMIMREAGYSFLAPPTGRYAYALDINDLENAVGSTENMRRSGFAVLWLKSQSFNGQVLGPRTIAATGISERDEVVGVAVDGAFVWKSGKYMTLSDVVSESGWTFETPAISRNGTVAAFGRNTDGRRGVVLVKLP